MHIESFLAKRRETTKELAAGRLDFAVDAPLNTDPQVRHVKLMEDRYVCAMRRGHWRQAEAGPGRLPGPDPHPAAAAPRHIDLALGKMGIQRKIALRSQHYLMASTVVQQTDMAMTVPERFARHHDLHYAVLPVSDVPKLETHLYWHESTDQDPANRWMREQIIELCQQVTARENKAAQPRERLPRGVGRTRLGHLLPRCLSAPSP